MKSRLAVVTGGAKPGYGEAITRRLINDGYRVIASFEAEHKTNADKLACEIANATFVEVEHSNRDCLRLLISKVPSGVDALVNAQFYFNMEDPDGFNHDLWDTSIAVNLTAPNFLVHELKGKFNDFGSIVTVTSTEGFIGSFGASAYAATKAAIHNLTKSWANNLGARNIRANAVAAGWIGGVMDTDEVFNMSRKITPLARLGAAEEIASVVAFLLSKDSSFVNGSVVTADGGYTGVDTIAKYEFEQTKKTQP